MNRVAIIVNEPEPGHLRFDIEGLPDDFPSSALIGGSEFMSLPVAQRFGLVLIEAIKQTDLPQVILSRCFEKLEEEALDEILEKTNVKYPCRCRITDPEGEIIGETEDHRLIAAKNPSAGAAKLGRTGTAHLCDDGVNVRIELDDGSTLMGYECWWEPIADLN